MRKLAVFTAVFLSKIFFACGFYPYGEDVRFHILDPKQFHYHQYSSFNYSALSFGNDLQDEVSSDKNEELWRKYCGNKVAVSEISLVLNKFSYSGVQQNSTNPFLKYLFKIKDLEAINYLKFAKNCEYFNTWQDDPWERNDSVATVKRDQLLQNAVSFANKSKKKDIKKRYAFLALRLAFYNNDIKSTKFIYNKYYSVDNAKDIVDYWALYFYAIAEKDLALKNYYLAKVFAGCPEKRFVCWQYFSSGTDKNLVLNYARSDVERSQILMMYSLYNPEKNLENIKEMYVNDPNDDALSFLLLREMSKMEDWILTPYYTLFSPSMQYDYWSENESEPTSTKNIFERVSTDRAYAKEVLQFIETVDLSKVENPNFWRLAKAELQFLTKDFTSSLNTISGLQRDLKPNDEILPSVEVLRTLNLFANQSFGKAIIPKETESIILKNKDNKQFIFALGRELEYLGNTDDAAFLYASLQDVAADPYDYGGLYFKSMENRNQTFSTYFYDYFSYLDAIYTPAQLQSFISKLNFNQKSTNTFYNKMHKISTDEIYSLQDLLGTKYIRVNDLNLALLSFQKLGSKYLASQDHLWEKDTVQNSHKNSFVFDENPFYSLKYTPEFIPEKETFRLNKLSITQKLMEYMNKAEDIQEKDRDYYYFLVANCYYNMSQYGNSWMMRRYYFSTADDGSLQNDDEEFISTNLAKFYYGKALEYAKTPKFKALCLRMQGRCESNKIAFEYESAYHDGKAESDYLNRLSKNKYYQDLKKSPKNYGDLMSNCDSFKDYFNSRR